MDATTLNCHKKNFAYKFALKASKLTNYAFNGHSCYNKLFKEFIRFNNYYQILCMVEASDTCITDARLELLIDKLDKLYNATC